MEQPRYRRVLLKMSGEVRQGDQGFGVSDRALAFGCGHPAALRRVIFSVNECSNYYAETLGSGYGSPAKLPESVRRALRLDYVIPGYRDQPLQSDDEIAALWQGILEGAGIARPKANTAA